MSSSVVPRIVPGLELVDDEGEEVYVQKINDKKGTAILKTDSGESYSMPLNELRAKLRDGDFARLEPEEEEADDEDDDDDEDDE